jgi:D-alanyl-D-alanine carboxypeptidase
VLQLVAEGRLRLDEPVGQLLPGLVQGGRSITVRDLLAHTSGLFDYTADPAVLRADSVWTPRSLIALALSHPRVFRPPGSAYAYSSTNYVLLGLVVERVTGRPLHEELERRLFRPLGLDATAFVPGSRIPGPHAHSYAPPVHDGIVSMHSPARDQSERSASWAWASGAVVSSTRDLATFFSALLGGRLLPRPLLDAMERPTPLSHGRYGLGLAVFPTPCGRVWGHTGNVLGYVTAVWSSRDGTHQVVLMANAYPLSQEAETAFRRALVGAFCSR